MNVCFFVEELEYKPLLAISVVANFLPIILLIDKKVVREERNKEKLTSGDWVMAEFYSIHSLKSSRMHAVIDEFKKLMGGKVEVVQVNVDEEKTLAEFYTIVHIPTYIFLRKGEQLWRQTGELGLDRLEKAVKEFMV